MGRKKNVFWVREKSIMYCFLLFFPRRPASCRRFCRWMRKKWYLSLFFRRVVFRFAFFPSGICLSLFVEVVFRYRFLSKWYFFIALFGNDTSLSLFFGVSPVGRDQSIDRGSFSVDVAGRMCFRFSLLEKFSEKFWKSVKEGRERSFGQEQGKKGFEMLMRDGFLCRVERHI